MASNESSRFQFSSEEQLSELAKGWIPENAKGSTKNFNLWLKSSNDANPENPVTIEGMQVRHRIIATVATPPS